jgi:hypothetical protein
MTTSNSNSSRKPFIVCGTPQGRAVIFGWLDEEPTKDVPIDIYNARMVLEWQGPDGLFGLAANGPKAGDRITPAVKRVRETTPQQWIELDAAAAAAFDNWGAK